MTCENVDLDGQINIKKKFSLTCENGVFDCCDNKIRKHLRNIQNLPYVI